METLIAVALTCAAFLSYFFYHDRRDRSLNFQAGRVFRAWVVDRMSLLLADADATPMAVRFAGLLLSFAYDHTRLRAMVASTSISGHHTFPSEALGEHADVVRKAMQYTAVLALLEKRSLANGLRRMMSSNDGQPIDIVQQLPFPQSLGIADGTMPGASWTAEAVDIVLRLPSGRSFEHAVEDRLLACAS